MAVDIKKYIQTERAKGTQDSKIYDAVKKLQSGGSAPQRTGAGEFLPTAFAIGGGILGGTLGTFAAPGVGTITGSIGGATAGGAFGEIIQQGIEKRFGQREQFNEGQIAATGVTSAALEATGIAALKSLKYTAPVLKYTQGKMVSFFKNISGLNKNVVERALQGTEGVKIGAVGGEPILVTMIKNSAKGLRELANRSVKESKEALNKLVKSKLAEDSLFAQALKSSASKYKSARTEIFNKAGDFIKISTQKLRDAHNIGATKTGELLFTRGNQPSRIVSGSEQKAIQEAWTLLKSVRKNLSLRHIDALYERLIVLKSKTPVGTPTGTETKKIIGSLIDDLTGFIERVYPQSYTDYLKTNLTKRLMISEAQELLGTSSNLTAKEISFISTRLLQLFNTGKLATREALESVGKFIKEDIVGTTSGVLMKEGEAISVRAPNLTRRGLVEKALEAIPRAALNNFVKTGKLTGELLNNKIVTRTANALRISVKTLIQEMVNLAENKTTK